MLGWIVIVLSLAAFIIGITQLPLDSFVRPNISRLAVVVLHPFIGTGLFEEVLFRGLILKLLLVKMGHTKKGIINAIIISSVIFGLLHIINSIAGTLEIATNIEQIVATTGFGFLYAVLYLRTKNLWVPILLHGFKNLFAGQIFGAIVSYEVMLELSQNQPVADTGSLITNILIVTLPVLITGLILLRKVKPDEIVVDS